MAEKKYKQRVSLLEDRDGVFGDKEDDAIFKDDCCPQAGDNKFKQRVSLTEDRDGLFGQKEDDAIFKGDCCPQTP